MSRLPLIPKLEGVKQPTAGTYLFVDYGVVAEPWHERYVLKVIYGRDHRADARWRGHPREV